MSAIATLESTNEGSKNFDPKGLVRFQFKNTFSTNLKLHIKDFGFELYQFCLYRHGDLSQVKEDEVPIASFVFSPGSGESVRWTQTVSLPVHEFIGRRVAIGDPNGQIIAQGVVAHSAPFDFVTVPMDLEWRSCSRSKVYR
jgi:hypothetical protein